MNTPNENPVAQCPHCGEESTFSDGVFVCPKGHQWQTEKVSKRGKLFNIPLVSAWNDEYSPQAKEEIDQLRLAGFEVQQVGLKSEKPAYLVQAHPKLDIAMRDIDSLGGRTVGKLAGESTEDPTETGE